MRQDKVRVGIIGSGFEADIHAASFQIMPEEAEVVAVASPTPGHAEALAQRYRIPRVFHDYREMLRQDDIEMVTITAPNYLHAQMTDRCSAVRKARGVREAAVHDARRGRPDDRRLPAAGRVADVRRGTLLHAQVRAGETDGRRRCVRQGLSGQAERKTLRAARRLVLGREAVWRWRADGHGLPQHRVLLLVPQPAAHSDRAVPAGHVRAPRQDAWGRQQHLHSGVRE